MADAVTADEVLTMALEDFDKLTGREGAIHRMTANEERAKSQRFFAALAAEMRKPSFGEMQAGWMRALLIRAQEASLYDPTQENA